MNVNSVLMRDSDCTLFYVHELYHWSIIKPLDGDEEDIDSVKWYGEKNGYMAFVSATSGHTYLLVQE